MLKANYNARSYIKYLMARRIYNTCVAGANIGFSDDIEVNVKLLNLVHDAVNNLTDFQCTNLNKIRQDAGNKAYMYVFFAYAPNVQEYVDSIKIPVENE